MSQNYYLAILAGLCETFVRKDLNFGLILGACVMIYNKIAVYRVFDQKTNNEIGPSTIFAKLSPMQLSAAPKTENHFKEPDS
jgi:hypothetical protein